MKSTTRTLNKLSNLTGAKKILLKLTNARIRCDVLRDEVNIMSNMELGHRSEINIGDTVVTADFFVNGHNTTKPPSSRYEITAWHTKFIF